MAVTEALKERGWNLSEEAVSQITENGSITDVKQIVQKALDIDLREISTSGFPEDLNKTKYETIPGSFVVQIQKIRNISAPKANEDSKAAPRMLKLSLTDGQISCQAVEVEYMPRISLDTPPGTKLFFKGDQLPMSHGYLLLRPSLIEVLGGKVPHLVEKWELNRTLAKHTRGRVGEEGGPPPWIPFGQKILKPNHQDRNFKSLETAKEKENRENAEFEAQRKDAIAEAARGGAKKIFGGGNKPLLDHNVQQIVDYGFTVEQAEYALRQNRNNVQRALKVLQRRVDGPRKDDGRERPRSEGKGKGGDERERKKRGERGGEEDGGAPPKPSGKVQLFAFLEDKLPVSSEKESEHKSASNINNTGSNTSGNMTSNSINADKKQFGTDMTNKASSNSRTNKTDRSNYSQSRNSGSRGGNVGGGSNSGGSRSNRGARGANTTTNNMTWSNGSDARSSGNFTSNSSTRDSDRGRHSSSAGNSGSTLQQQKPPRFQNQQRFQQQQQQQQPQQQQQQQQQSQQQLNDNFYGQPWANSYTETQYNTNTWSSKNSVPNSSNSKIRDDYVNHEAFSSLGYEMNKNRSRSNNAGSGGFGMNFEPDTDTRLLGNRLERMGNTRNYPPQQDILNNKFGTLPQSGIGHDTYSNYTSPPPRIQQTQQLYGGAEFTAYKDPVQPTVSSNAHNSPGNSYGNPGQGLYGSPSNHYIADSKVWRWQKGDKCMAKYWEDNVYYNAEVTGVSDRTCVVRFVEYGNYEEVLQDDCIPITDEGLGQSIQSSSAFSSSSDSLPPQNNQNHFSGILEFRRGGTRPYIKSAGADRKPPRIQQQLYMPPAQRK